MTRMQTFQEPFKSSGFLELSFEHGRVEVRKEDVVCVESVSPVGHVVFSASEFELDMIDATVATKGHPSWKSLT
jgi:hypothetical protein